METSGVKGEVMDKQINLIKDTMNKISQADVDMITGQAALNKMLATMTTATKAAQNAKTKFTAVNKKWNDRLVQEKEKRRGDISDEYETAKKLITELTMKMSIASKKDDQAAYLKINELLTAQKNKFENADRQMQELNVEENMKQ